MSGQSRKAYLLLENGKLIEGRGFGAAGSITGEVVFTTAMVGYLETLSDPSFYGQLVVQTFPLIGNYGMIPSDFESVRPQLKGYIVREWCEYPSNFRSQGTLDAFLAQHGIVGLYGLDTRALTKVIREHGVMNGRILTDPSQVPAQLEALRQFKVTDSVRAVSCREIGIDTPYEAKRRVVLWDFGAKENIKRELMARGSEVVCVPAWSTAEQIMALSPDGIMLSNGPGDPAENGEIIAQLTKLCDFKIPMFGICLGHQLLALSQGAQTHKLKYGHRGANQPVKDLDTGRIYITSQNHGYAVIAQNLPGHIHLSQTSVNDETCEGLVYRDMPAFSVQYHPEGCAGPLDTRFLFDRFISAIDSHMHGIQVAV